ncbi:MAG: hypothetical protein L6427_04050 [Actinomycetia bacterium]|nr:hypothetical protein [Actinomycetota bacterium]MCG2795032.1 hypothetical protein [Actinomycetes bacterium]
MSRSARMASWERSTVKPTRHQPFWGKRMNIMSREGLLQSGGHQILKSPEP